MKSRLAFTLVELLVVIAIIAVLLAVLMPALRYAKGISQRLICQTRLKDIGKGLSVYAGQYDGLMPSPASNPGPGEVPSISTPYEICQLQADGVTKLWMNLGCLYKAGMIADGRQLYCPGTAEWYKEYYEDHQIAPDGTRVPWGTLPLRYCAGSGWQRIQTTKGYAFWPQARRLMTDYDLARTSRGSGPRYLRDYPATPAKYDELNPNKSLACDYTVHTVKGSGYNVNVVFSDTHVNMQKIPTSIVGGQLRYWYPYQSQPAPDSPTSQWLEINTSQYMFALQP
jgi:prepilin-type N-terminal cleavage/methylation domain-containing protein